MKSLIATGLVLCAGIVGSLAPATSAHALPIMHAGQICHARSDSRTANFDYSTVGITARVSNAGEVICPLVTERDVVTGGLSVDVSVSGNGPNAGRTSCSLASHNFTGEFLGADTGTIDPPAEFVSLRLEGNQTRRFAHYSVTCNLPRFQTLTNITVF